MFSDTMNDTEDSMGDPFAYKPLASKKRKIPSPKSQAANVKKKRRTVARSPEPASQKGPNLVQMFRDIAKTPQKYSKTPKGGIIGALVAVVACPSLCSVSPVPAAPGAAAAGRGGQCQGAPGGLPGRQCTRCAR